MEDQVALFCAMRRYVGPDARISAQMFRRATSVVSASATFKKSVYVLTQDQFALVRDKIPDIALLDTAHMDLPPTLRGQEWIYIDKMVPGDNLGPNIAEYEVALKEKLMHTDKHMDNGDGSLIFHNAAGSSHEPLPHPLQPSGALRVLEREISGDKDLVTSLETMAEKIRLAFDRFVRLRWPYEFA